MRIKFVHGFIFIPPCLVSQYTLSEASANIQIWSPACYYCSYKIMLWNITLDNRIFLIYSPQKLKNQFLLASLHLWQYQNNERSKKDKLLVSSRIREIIKDLLNQINVWKTETSRQKIIVGNMYHKCNKKLQ